MKDERTLIQRTLIQRTLSELQSKMENLKVSCCQLQKETEKIDECSKKWGDLPGAECLVEDIEYLENYKGEQLESEKRIAKLKLFCVKSNLKTRYDELDNMRELLESKQKTFEKKKWFVFATQLPNDDSTYEKIFLSEEKHRVCLKTKRELEERLRALTKAGIELDVDTVKERDTVCDELKELRANRTLHEKNLEKIQRWEASMQKQEELREREKSKDKLKLEFDSKRREHAAAKTLKEKVVEAENISICGILDSINTHAQSFLDYFFAEESLVATLKPFKKVKATKSSKPSINLEIEYKGMEIDAKCLSGGEHARLVLAYTLALGEMFNLPMIFLDESTASLDAVLTTKVFKSISKSHKDKLVLIIAHQVVTGIFEKTIEI